MGVRVRDRIEYEIESRIDPAERAEQAIQPGHRSIGLVNNFLLLPQNPSTLSLISLRPSNV